MASKPQFETLAITLAAADAQTRVKSADAAASRAERSVAAVETITAAVKEKVAVEDARQALLAAGVLKGTVSKIVQIIQAIDEGILTVGQVTSLNGAYNSIRAARLAAAGTPSPAMMGPATVATISASTPTEALQIILDAIKAAGDVDAIIAAGSEWVTLITGEITKITQSAIDGEDED